MHFSLDIKQAREKHGHRYEYLYLNSAPAPTLERISGCCLQLKYTYLTCPSQPATLSHWGTTNTMYAHFKLILCEAALQPPEDVRQGIWKRAVWQHAALFLCMFPRGLSPDDTGVIFRVLLKGRSPLRKKKLCCSTSQEKVVHIYFNEEGGDVNNSLYRKPPLLFTSHLP